MESIKIYGPSYRLTCSISKHSLTANSSGIAGYVKGSDFRLNFTHVSITDSTGEEIHDLNGILISGRYICTNSKRNPSFVNGFFQNLFLELEIIDNRIDNFSFSFMKQSFIEGLKGSGSHWKSTWNAEKWVNDNVQVSEDEIKLELIIAKAESVGLMVEQYLQLSPETVLKSYEYELDLLRDKLEEAIRNNEKPLFLLEFFLSLVNFCKSDFDVTLTVLEKIETPGDELGEIIKLFIIKMKNYIVMAKTAKQLSPSQVMLIPSSLRNSDVSDIMNIRLFKKIFTSGDRKYVILPDLDEIEDIDDLINRIGLEKLSDVIFMGHGNRSEGMAVYIQSRNQFLNMNHLSEIEKIQELQTIVTLACEAEFYENMNISSEISIIYNVGEFNFPRMELFTAGFVQGRVNGYTTEQCIWMGLVMLELRLDHEVDIRVKSKSGEYGFSSIVNNPLHFADF